MWGFEEYQPYSNLTELNTHRNLLDTVGKETLDRIAESYLDLLGTSVAIYEADGSYVTALFSSGYCKLMCSCSRELCGFIDNARALASGKWLCHESCWTNASRITIETGKPYDLKPCEGGLNIYAVPIKASGKTVGSINCGYGTPASDDKTIDELIEKYKVDKQRLLEAAKEYKARPEYVVEAAKKQLLLSAELIGGIYERNKLTAKLVETEERLNTSFEFSTLGTAITLPETKGWLRVNDAFCTMMGYSREEMMRLMWVEITHPGDVKATGTQINRVLAGETDGFSLDKRYIRKDGTVIYATLWVNCKRGAGGKAEYFIVMLQDITLKKKMEEELRLQSEIMINMAEGVILIKTGDGRIVYANPKFNSMFGYANGELAGRNISIVNACTESASGNISPEEVAEQIMSALKQTGNWEGEVLNIKKDGTRFWCQAVVSTFEHSIYGPVWISIHHDITKRKEAEDELRNEHDKRLMQENMLMQQSKMAAMGDMIAAIAHQWKQPISNLALFIQDIRDAYNFGELDETYINMAVDKSMREIQFMAKTIDDFMNFFKPSTELETVDLIEITSTIFSILLAQLKINTISYSITCHIHNRTFKSLAEVIPCEATSITTNKNQLAHVILNIINNAKDAIILSRHSGLPGVSDEGMISVDCSKEGETVKLSISDNGGGIPEKIIDKIFEPYFSTKPESEGTGIGLYMSKIIVEEKLGGRISVRNIEGGAVFTLQFTV